ncbi:hypothetical protein C9374_012281 [Naegleria lovaniensis]|uniref:Kinesin motor domain-containing protein n=1 Tax=Naegleria lovaniensis TaxID=51637 RepID=A0AA88G834_NAELO|nr:uncharacterized protein C9374_012281 [Naegleria lovaniensis]KAG2373292.1 hypothetical protein C9374_012281 [Naegleria lovaniensis]
MTNNPNHNLSGIFSPSQELERMLSSPRITTTTATRRNPFQTPSSSLRSGGGGIHNNHHSLFTSPIVVGGSHVASTLFSPQSSSCFHHSLLLEDETLMGSTRKSDIFAKQDDDDKSSVRVVVRVRPLADHETQNCVQVDTLTKRTLQISTNPREKPKAFTFDYVANPLTTQKEIFDCCGKPIVDSCLSGYNGTIFCYGQTGSGKTFTMGTSFDDDRMIDDDIQNYFNVPSSYGLIPRVIYYLFSEIEKRRQQSDIKFIVSCSLLEIYMEKITDLLDMTPKIPSFDGSTSGKSLTLREDFKTGVYVEDLTHEDVLSPKDALNILQKGLPNRHVGATAMNDRSSRSHSVFTIYIKSQEVAEGGTKIRTSRLNLIDLAGSERQSTSHAEGERLKEACAINKSLSTLGKVIKDLVDVANGISRHVQYRDSKLTFLLKDSLGGNSKTCVIANISPAVTSLSETLSTLTFAQRAKRIKNEAKINEETSGSIPFLQEQIKILRKQLLEANKKIQDVPPALTPPQPIPLDDLEKENYMAELQNQHIFLSSQLDEMEEKNSSLSYRVEELKKALSSKDKLLASTRFFLRLRESRIARMSGKTQLKISDGFVSGAEFDFDKTNDFDFDFENFTLENEDKWLSKAETLFQKALSPEQHPDVIMLKIENIELKEKLNEYESQFSKEFAANRELYRDLHQYIQSLESSIRHLTGEKEKLQAKIKEMEKTYRRTSAVIQTQIQSNENQTLLGEITRLEQANEESLETINTLKQELEKSQENEQLAWKQLESAKQLVDEIAAEKEECVNVINNLKESLDQRNEVMQIIDDIEKQQQVQQQREEQLLLMEESLKLQQTESQKQVEELMFELEKKKNEIEELKSKLSQNETFSTLVEQYELELQKMRSVLSDKDYQIETLNNQMHVLNQTVDNNMKEAALSIEEIKLREEMIKLNSENELSLIRKQLEDSLQQLQDTKEFYENKTRVEEENKSSELSELQTKIESLNNQVDSLSFREQELLLCISEKESLIQELSLREKESLMAMQELRGNENTLKQEVESLKEEVKQLTDLILVSESHKNQIEEKLTQQMLEITTQLEESCTQVNILTTNLEEKQKLLDEKNHELEMVRQAQTIQDTTLSDALLQIASLNETVQNKVQLLQEKEREISDVKSRLEFISEEFSVERQQLQEKVDMSEQSMKEISEKYEQTVQELSQTKAHYEDKLNSLKEAILFEQDKNDELINHVNSIGNVSEEEKKQILEREALAKEEYEKEIHNLQELVQALNMENKSITEERQSLLNNFEEFKTEKREELEKIQTLLSQYQEQVDTIIKEKEDLSRQLNDRIMNETINLKVKEAELENLKAELEKSQTSNVEMNDRLVDSLNKLKLSEETVTSLEKQTQSLRDTLDENKKTIREQEEQLLDRAKVIASLESENSKLQQENSTLSNTVEKLRMEIEKKQLEIDQQQDLVRQLTSGDEMSHLQEQLVQFKKKCDTLSQSLQSERDLVLKKETQINELGSTLDDLNEKLSSLEKSKLAQQMQQEEKLQRTKEQYETAQKRLEEEIEFLKLKASESVTEAAQLKDELESLRKDHEMIIGHNNHKQKIQYQMKIKQENNDLKDELMRAQKLLLEKDNIIRKFQKQDMAAIKPLFSAFNATQQRTSSDLPKPLFSNSVSTLKDSSGNNPSNISFTANAIPLGTSTMNKTSTSPPTGETPLLRERASIYVKRGSSSNSIAEMLSNASSSIPPIPLLSSATTSTQVKERPLQLGRSKGLLNNGNLKMLFSESNKENIEIQQQQENFNLLKRKDPPINTNIMNNSMMHESNNNKRTKQ